MPLQHPKTKHHKLRGQLLWRTSFVTTSVTAFFSGEGQDGAMDLISSGELLCYWLAHWPLITKKRILDMSVCVSECCIAGSPYTHHCHLLKNWFPTVCCHTSLSSVWGCDLFTRNLYYVPLKTKQVLVMYPKLQDCFLLHFLLINQAFAVEWDVHAICIGRTANRHALKRPVIGQSLSSPERFCKAWTKGVKRRCRGQTSS